jgi:transcriptional regulator with GAF, ATPase, and Fis domain
MTKSSLRHMSAREYGEVRWKQRPVGRGRDSPAMVGTVRMPHALRGPKRTPRAKGVIMATIDGLGQDPHLGRLRGIVLTEATLDIFLDITVREARSSVGADEAGISLIRDGRPTTAAWTSELVRRVDQLQYEKGSGPCLQAIADGQMHRIPSTREDRAFEDFSTAAAGADLLSTLSIPLIVDRKPLGALNFYSRHRRGFSDDAETVASSFSEQASVLIANAQSYYDHAAVIEQLKEALETRDIIGTAKGILMEREGLTPDESFDQLVKVSQHTNTKLREIAAKFVECAGRPRGG